MVLTQCAAGVVGSFPALNARTSDMLSEWLTTIANGLREREVLTGQRPAPYAVNLTAHPSNGRLMDDLDICTEHRVPIIITSLSVRADVIERVHGWGGIVLHDVVNSRHARKARSQGVDGLILVAAGAGGHAGNLNPFAFVLEVRSFYTGPLVLGGAIGSGAGVLAAQALGADMVYMGTRFIATDEASAPGEYKQMLLDAVATDILYTPRFSLASANFLKANVERAGFNPETAEPLNAAEGSAAIVWRDIWSAGHGVALINDLPKIGVLVERMKADYTTARAALLET
jgi:nitronate monooxygenase